MAETTEIKELGSVCCPYCSKILTLKKRVTYNQPDPRRKISEEYLGERSKQQQLPHERSEKPPHE